MQPVIVDLLITYAWDHFHAAREQGGAVDPARCFSKTVTRFAGLALKHGISLPNTPGTIDSDYRGELKVILINHGAEAFEIRRGDRVAQLVLAPVTQGSWLEVSELDETARGEGGFGSTGGVVALGS